MTPAANAIPPASAPADDLVASLEAVFSRLIAEHEALAALAKSHRDALARADSPALHQCISHHAAAAQRIAALESTRADLAGQLADRLGLQTTPPAPGPLTFSALAIRLPAAARERLAPLAERLRTLLATLRREHAVIRSATESLAAHMDGLMRQLGNRLSHTGLYAPPSRRNPLDPHSHQVLSALDLTT